MRYMEVSHVLRYPLRHGSDDDCKDRLVTPEQAEKLRRQVDRHVTILEGRDPNPIGADLEQDFRLLSFLSRRRRPLQQPEQPLR